MTTTCTATLAKITKVEFRRHYNGLLLSAGEGEWAAKITRADGTQEVTYRDHMPATNDERMNTWLYYVGHNSRLDTYIWKAK
jgi:hypothetical protein